MLAVAVRRPLSFRPCEQHFHNPCGANEKNFSRLSRIAVHASHESKPEITQKHYDSKGKRKIVEHIVLYRTKEGISQEEEKDMLDFLYTSQYYMRGILSISLGCIINKNPEGYTHAVCMRFPSKEVLEDYYTSTIQSNLLDEHVIPYCHRTMSIDFEADVEDDIIPLFRRGEDFEHGIEFLILIAAREDASTDAIWDALAAFLKILHDVGSMIVQCTYGVNFCSSSDGYTHSMIVRLSSEEALQIFRGSKSYAYVWNQKILPISGKILTIYYMIDPIGKTIM